MEQGRDKTNGDSYLRTSTSNLLNDDSCGASHKTMSRISHLPRLLIPPHDKLSEGKHSAEGLGCCEAQRPVCDVGGKKDK
ncbi:hypothetical protein SRHO_G00225800 [Serrasalmus rhombeus]